MSRILKRPVYLTIKQFNRYTQKQLQLNCLFTQHTVEQTKLNCLFTKYTTTQQQQFNEYKQSQQQLIDNTRLSLVICVFGIYVAGCGLIFYK